MASINILNPFTGASDPRRQKNGRKKGKEPIHDSRRAPRGQYEPHRAN